MKGSAWCVVALVAAVGGCADGGGKGAPAMPAAGAGKQDGPAVPTVGELGFGAPVTGALTAPGEFHGWTLAVRAGATARLEITHAGSSSALDGTLFVYGPDGRGGLLPVPEAMDDDSGWGRLPRLDHAFASEGTYLIVVGSFDAIGKGAYRLAATCSSGDCAPPAGVACDPRLLDGMKGCVTDWRYAEDPDMTRPPTTGELVEWCTDAEPVAPVRDAICEEDPGATFCPLDYEAFVAQAIPPCRELLRAWTQETSCALGVTWSPVAQGAAWGLVETDRTVIASAEGLSALEAERVVLALHASAHTDVTTAAEAIERTDDDELLRIALWDLTNGRAYEAYTFHSGDNLFGAAFAHGTAEVVARVNDGFLEGCAVQVGPAFQPCATTADCGAGLTCVGAAEQTWNGRCVDTAPLAGEQTPCSAASPCPEASGLVCAGASLGGEGLCGPAWSRGAFVDVAEAPIPEGVGAPLERSVEASGLLTVTTDAWLRAVIAHGAPEQLRVVLVNPLGTESVVYEGTSTGPELILDQPVPVPGDEPANGSWTLRVTDTKKGVTGTLSRWTLTLGSRWD